MASGDMTVKVGLEMTEPNWPMLCMAISNHATRALACLEGDRPDMAIESLRHAAAVIEMGTSVVHMPLDPMGVSRDSL